MAISSLSLVNQKLAYVRVLLQTIPGTPPANNGERLHQQALLDAVVFHLICGYRHYLCELAENYRVKNFAAINSESSLLEALDKLEKMPSEATELQHLRQQQDSWLAQMHDYYDSLWRLPLSTSMPSKTALPGDDLISVITLDAASSEVEQVTLGKIVEWQSAFSSLVARHRETSCEY